MKPRVIERQGGRVLVDARRAGWRSSKIGSDWLHRCPDCADGIE